ncbi:MAG: biotin/lipoyl-binding carrier protein [Nocardioides sp.]|nr:biotin/lipoyl-binding carrier protein [Nocardioides sp.]
MAREQVVEVVAEMVANVMSVEVAVGDVVAVGDTLVMLESMKMEIPVLCEAAGTVRAVKVDVGDVVQEGSAMVQILLG